jgi:hypothetical protein
VTYGNPFYLFKFKQGIYSVRIATGEKITQLFPTPTADTTATAGVPVTKGMP